MRALRHSVVAALVALAPVVVHAQQLGTTLDSGTVQSPVLVIEFDRVFAQSAFGQRVVAQIEAEGAEIATENRRIENELQDEEQQLTEQRAQVDSESFKALANAFDEKVQKLREEQDAKAKALTRRREDEQRRFLSLMRPVLEALMQESGATVILDRRSVFLSLSAVDVSNKVIETMDQTVGEGTSEPATDP